MEPSSVAATASPRSVMVTGGAGALGRAVVRRLLDKGAHCHVPVIDPAELAGSDLAADPRVTIHVPVDLRDEARVEALYAAVGHLDASIHLAGGFSMAPIAEVSLSDVRAQLELNLQTAFLCCRAAILRFRAQRGGGHIVNVAARPALQPTGGMIAYSIAKAAVAALTTSLAMEVADERIWVNAVLPSTMDTPANRAAMPTADPSRWASVDEVARVIEFLASTENGCTRGALVPVFGRTG